MRGERAIFNLQIKKKSGLSLNPDIHHSKVFSSVNIILSDPQFFIDRVAFRFNNNMPYMLFRINLYMN